MQISERLERAKRQKLEGSGLRLVNDLIFSFFLGYFFFCRLSMGVDKGSYEGTDTTCAKESPNNVRGNTIAKRHSSNPSNKSSNPDKKTQILSSSTLYNIPPESPIF